SATTSITNSFPTRRSSDLKMRSESFTGNRQLSGRTKCRLGLAAGSERDALRVPRDLTVPADTHAEEIGAVARARGVQDPFPAGRSEEHTSELQSQSNLVCR